MNGSWRGTRTFVAALLLLFIGVRNPSSGRSSRDLPDLRQVRRLGGRNNVDRRRGIVDGCRGVMLECERLLLELLLELLPGKKSRVALVSMLFTDGNCRGDNI